MDGVKHLIRGLKRAIDIQDLKHLPPIAIPLKIWAFGPFDGKTSKNMCPKGPTPWEMKFAPDANFWASDLWNGGELAHNHSTTFVPLTKPYNFVLTNSSNSVAIKSYNLDKNCLSLCI